MIARATAFLFFFTSLVLTVGVGASAPDCSYEASPLTFDTAVYRLLNGSKTLRVSNAAIGEKYGIELQTRFYQNPLFSYTYEGGGGNSNNRGNDSGSAESSFELSQLFELGGKKGFRNKAALYDYYAAISGFEAERITQFNLLRKAFLNVAACQEQIRLCAEELQISRNVLNAVQCKADAGKAGLIELNKSKIALANAEIEFSRAQTNLQVEKNHLSALWGCPCADFGSVLFSFEELVAPSCWDECIGCFRNNPELAQAYYTYLAAKQSYQLEKAYRVPDVTLTAGYNYVQNSAGSGVILGVAFPFPILDSNKGAICSAQWTVDKSYEEFLEVRTLLEKKLCESYRQLTQAYQEVLRYRSTILKTAKESLELACEGYKEGKFDYMDLLDSQRTYCETRGVYIQTLLTYHTLSADIQYLNTQAE